ncbi:sulfite exporter TauE/SafE family protein [Tepidibacillus sp. HK-1]|uniref:urease accessory protein UreH domain-containing protein n=1 Tax=Tepidibacillus sp. HK-1 TaxID=1883407 RepID=UPI0008538B8E|nr:sulfite exporter TauE/SafE family protein [Tepidibacillus sp. HK-1]GBF10568.1 high-affinity nickel-transport protein [Tepidibacillus sp. HK-1]
MEVGFLEVLMIGFVLGMKHAIEPDHIIAVSTIASQSKSLWRSSLAGVFWGIGHTATIFIVGISFIWIKGEIPVTWAMSLEFLVGIMLVVLGVSTILTFKKNKIHVHHHEHNGIAHIHFHDRHDSHVHPKDEKKLSYLKSLMIGFIHGLAGSAAMIILTMSTVHNPIEGAIYIIVFGVGTTISMLSFTTLIGIPFVLSAKHIQMNQSLTIFAGALSMIFGFYYMYNLGITEGLFSMWVQ